MPKGRIEVHTFERFASTLAGNLGLQADDLQPATAVSMFLTDSLAVFEMIVTLEEDFGVAVPDEWLLRPGLSIGDVYQELLTSSVARGIADG